MGYFTYCSKTEDRRVCANVILLLAMIIKYDQCILQTMSADLQRMPPQRISKLYLKLIVIITNACGGTKATKLIKQFWCMKMISDWYTPYTYCHDCLCPSSTLSLPSKDTKRVFLLLWNKAHVKWYTCEMHVKCMWYACDMRTRDQKEGYTTINY